MGRNYIGERTPWDAWQREAGRGCRDARRSEAGNFWTEPYLCSMPITPLIGIAFNTRKPRWGPIKVT